MKYLVLLPLCCALAAAGLYTPQTPVGQVVHHAEAEGVMGHGCSKYGTNRWYCFGGNCMSGGCGCAFRASLVPGQYKNNIATPCATSNVCTQIQFVLSSFCGS